MISKTDQCSAAIGFSLLFFDSQKKSAKYLSLFTTKILFSPGDFN